MLTTISHSGSESPTDMVSKQLSSAGYQLNDDADFHFTASELDQQCSDLYNVLENLQEDEQAANFISQMDQQSSSNDSTTMTSTKQPQKRKTAATDSDGHATKKSKVSRAAKQDASHSEPKQSDFITEYSEQQERAKAAASEYQQQVTLLNQLLQGVKSVEAKCKTSATRTGMSTAGKHMSNVIEIITTEMNSCGAIDSCRFCKNDSNPPKVISKKCGHGFCCMNCIHKYWELVYTKNNGRMMCLKCKVQYDGETNVKHGPGYVVIG
jgi:hypothetical protein